ncbi:MAG: universal stress protein [Dehalococcoidia bacterium]|jgi:nucleotide-binding universal stress UspA family protein
MYERILVPLDGSKRAECVLPHVEALAKTCATAEVILVWVAERVIGYRVSESGSQPMWERTASVAGARMSPEAVAKEEKQGQEYLAKMAKILEDKGVKVRTEVLMGKPAEEIVIYANNKKCDLIVIASHGRSGFARWTHGSVADRVFKATAVPILMIKAPDYKGI